MFKVSTGNREYAVELTGGTSGTIDGEQFELSVIPNGEAGFHILYGNTSYRAEVLKANPEEKSVTVRVNNRNFTLQVKDKYDLLLSAMGLSATAGKKINELKSPMPGMVLEILVEPGAAVKTGDQLLILEAMKMENVLKSPTDGVIKKVAAVKGKAVEKNELLIVFE